MRSPLAEVTLLLLLLLGVFSSVARGWIVVVKRRGRGRGGAVGARPRRTITTALEAAGGFGGGGGGGAAAAANKKKKRDVARLKPKQQWDRYDKKLKKFKAVPVAVRVRGGDGEEEDWLEVGNVKSEGDRYSAQAVSRQRALIAEVRVVNEMLERKKES
jgi:hypothetical protein